MSDVTSTIRFLPPHATHVLIAVNPRAGARSGRRRVDRLQLLLQGRGFVVDIETDGERLRAAATAAVTAGVLRAVVAAGGDGTAAMVANCTPQGAPILPYPLGTENLLAKRLGVTRSPDLACQTICHGAAVRWDAGQANGRIFLLMASCGFDAEVVRQVHAERQGNIRRLAYAKPIWNSIRSYEYPELRVYCDVPARTGGAHGGRSGESQALSRQPIRGRWVFVANLPCYAAGLRIVPDAVGTDGLLNLCALERGSFWSGLRYLGGVILGRHQSWADCVSLAVRQLRIESDTPVPYQLDGDPGGVLPVDVSVLPERLTLLFPALRAARKGVARTGPRG